MRAVAFHPTLPLFASAGDDTHIHVLHGSVPQDLAENPTIVPLCQLLGHNTNEYMGVTDVVFHPTQPWLLSAGADHTLRLYVERY